MIFSFQPSSFHEQDYEKQNGSGTSYECPSDCKTYLEMFFFSDLSPGKFGDLVKHGFWVIPKVIFANLRKPIQDIIIPLSSGPLKLENVERMGEKSQKFKDV